MLAMPLFGVWWLLRARDTANPRAKGALVPVLAVTSIGLSAASTLFWFRSTAPKACDNQVGIFITENLHATNCRDRMHARLGETTKSTYGSKTTAYWYDGCHPVYAASSQQNEQHWDVVTGMIVFGYEALATLNSQIPQEETLRATCPPTASAEDPVCAFALAKGGCKPINSEVVTCELSGADRKAILAKAPPAPRGK
jgi:hypothetical protein